MLLCLGTCVIELLERPGGWKPRIRLTTFPPPAATCMAGPHTAACPQQKPASRPHPPPPPCQRRGPTWFGYSVHQGGCDAARWRRAAPPHHPTTPAETGRVQPPDRRRAPRAAAAGAAARAPPPPPAGRPRAYAHCRGVYTGLWQRRVCRWRVGATRWCGGSSLPIPPLCLLHWYSHTCRPILGALRAPRPPSRSLPRPPLLRLLCRRVATPAPGVGLGGLVVFYARGSAGAYSVLAPVAAPRAWLVRFPCLRLGGPLPSRR